MFYKHLLFYIISYLFLFYSGRCKGGFFKALLWLYTDIFLSLVTAVTSDFTIYTPKISHLPDDIACGEQ